MSAQYELDDPPTDYISSVQFSPNGQKLLVGCWDNTISVYQRTENAEKPFALQTRIQAPAPVLDVAWGKDETVSYIAGLDKCVRRIDWDKGAEQVYLNKHEKASNKVKYSREHGLVLSTSWDGTLHVHNTEIGGTNLVRVSLPAKPFALALTEGRAVVAMAERKMWIYDLLALKMLTQQTSDEVPIGESNLGEIKVHNVEPWQTRESNLKWMTRAVATMPDGTGFASSSIEGRVAVEWFDAEKAADTYAFKCHRQTVMEPGEDNEQREIDIIYPVHAIAFNKVHGTFATGGGDGVIALWDAQSKRRVRQYNKLVASVAGLDFTPDGKYLAAVISPGIESGQEEFEPDPNHIKVLVRELSENEAKGRPAKSKSEKPQ